MSENKDLVLESRYIHTGNSGVTISVERDVRRPTRAILTIHNGAFGAFSTDMVIRGNEHDGMTADQLRDLSLVFLESANLLDDIKNDKKVKYLWGPNSTPSILSATNNRRETPERIKDFVRNERLERLQVEGKGRPIDLMKDFEEDEEDSGSAGEVCLEAVGVQVPTSGNEPPTFAYPEGRVRKPKKQIDQAALVRDRLRHLVNKL